MVYYSCMAKIFIRNFSVNRLLDTLFVSAVGTVLILRAFLYLTSYPSLGGHSLHIAHMLWGGIFMVASVILLLAFLGKRVQHISAIVGGIGFGLFIDELGKFITHDNNYFFQPAVMLIYIIFVGLYFITRSLERSIKLSEEEKLVNALELAKEAVMKHFDAKERDQMIALLTGRHQAPMFGHLRQLMDETVLLPIEQSSGPRKKLEFWYITIVRSQFFHAVIIALLIAQGGLIILSFLSFGYYSNLNSAEQTIVLIGIGSAILAGCYVLHGLLLLRGSRLKAFQKLYRANLISILLTQPFAFYVATFVPMLALAISLGSMFTLQYLINQERKLLKRTE